MTDVPPTEADPSPDGINQGRSVEFSVAVAGHCSYNWTGTFTSSLPGSDGISCAVQAAVGEDFAAAQTAAATSRDGILDVADTPEAIVDTLRLGVADDVCNSVAKLNVDIPRPTHMENGDVCRTQPHSGAILNTTFTVTANPAKDQNDECAAVSDETEVNDKDTTIGDTASNDDTVGVTLTVVRRPLSDGSVRAECDYNVSADLPGGFVATTPGKPGSESESVKNYGLVPDTKLVDDRGDINGNGNQDAGIGEDPDTASDTVAHVGCRLPHRGHERWPGRLLTRHDKTMCRRSLGATRASASRCP